MVKTRLPWGSTALAKEDYDAVISLNPDDAIAHYNRGVCIAKLGDLGRAIEDFDAAIGLDRPTPFPTSTGPAPTPSWATRSRRWRTST